MNMKIRISMGAAVLATVGAIAFVPASADQRDEVAYHAAGAVVAQTVNIPETPQDQVWDMTYGAERPAVVQETAPAAEEDAPIVDYTFG
jgi:hypothetical protein